MSDKIREALAGMLVIVDESRGVDGYHLNGDIAEWDTFPEVEAARAAIAEQPAPAVPEGFVLLTAEQIANHALTAAECAPQSKVLLVSSINRLHEKNTRSDAPAAPVAVQKPVAWPQAAHDLVRDWQTGMVGSNDVCIALASAVSRSHPAAEQPDAVKVPRELLEELRDLTLLWDSGMAGVLRGQVDRLLAVGGA